MTENTTHLREDQVLEAEVRRHVAVTNWNGLIRMVEQLYNWGRRSSIWPLQFGLACCAIEMICTAASRYDIARFGAELFRASPRQADLMIVSGTVTKRMVPMVVRLYNQMPEPKYILSMGACASAGGPFKEGYNVVSGIDKFLPVDVYVPGCPPTPQALLHGLMTLQKIIDGQSIQKVRWYNKPEGDGIAVPVLGPDLLDVSRQDEIKQKNANRPALTPAVSPPILPAPEVTDGEENKELIQKINELVGAGSVQPQQKALLVDPKKWLEVARFLRDVPDLKFDYLSNLTSVDYEGLLEVVADLFSVERGGEGLTIKTRVDKKDPKLDSLTLVWSGADLQEREIYDMMGVRFEGHPNLKRILMWEGFEGHPLRKDFLEPYYEVPGKLYPSRWKEGHHERAEMRAFWRDNVQYPSGWDPSQFKTHPDEVSPPASLTDQALQRVGSDMLMVNLGPQHPSTHGVFRMKVAVEGERVVALEPVIGYMHRCHEKIGERNNYLMNFPYTDRLDYICSMGNNFAYALAVEQLLGVKPSERSEYIRVLMAELTRVLNHFWAIGFLLNDLGAFFTPALYAIQERELILDLFEMVSGSRMMCNYFRFGGVAKDLPEEFLSSAQPLIRERLPKAVDQLDNYLSQNEILLSRCQGVGVLSKEDAVAVSAAGPVLRGSTASTLWPPWLKSWITVMAGLWRRSSISAL